jgi:hypothetical protein
LVSSHPRYQVSNGVQHVLFHGAHRKSQAKADLLIGKPFEPPEYENSARLFGQLEQDHTGFLQGFSAHHDPVGSDIGLGVQVRLERNVAVGKSGLAAARSVLENTGRSLKDIAVQMFELIAVAAPHDTKEHFLDEIVHLVGIAHMALEKTSQGTTQNF